jgi:hypothetical protein
MITVFGIIVIFMLCGNLIISYLDYKEEQKNKKKLKENITKAKMVIWQKMWRLILI